MRKNTISPPLLSNAIGAFGFLLMACSQPIQAPSQAETSKKTPIDRLVKAAAQSKMVTPLVAPVVTPAPVETLESEAEKQSRLDAQKAKLEAMAMLLLGNAPKAEVNNREANEVPSPEAGPKLLQTKSVARIARRIEPVQVTPVDELAAENLASTLTDARFSEVITNWRGIRNCVKSITARGLGGSGALKVSFKINAEGKADASNSIAQRVGKCVTRQARKIQFPAYAGTEVVSKEAKFVF
jgi:hypothetical protein